MTVLNWERSSKQELVATRGADCVDAEGAGSLKRAGSTRSAFSSSKLSSAD